MKRAFAPLLIVCLSPVAWAQTAPQSSWIDDVLPLGAHLPIAVGTHNCLELYPAAELAARIEGTTSLAYRIAEDGGVTKVEVRKSSGNAALDKAATACVKAWQYQPATLADKPIEIAWRNDVKWAINPKTGFAVVPIPAAPPPSVPLINIPSAPVATQRVVPPPPPPAGHLSMPAAAGAPHVCIRYYPRDAVAERSQGVTTLGFIIDEDGRVSHIHVVISSGYAALDDMSVTCASDWLYSPAKDGGLPVAVPWKAEIRWLIH